jgi:glycosyltransferase involved in cell wall biosynthesis
MKLYLYPARSKNRFLELNKIALKKLGFTFDKVGLFFIYDLLHIKKDRIVVLNWVEDRVYGRKIKRFFQAFVSHTLLIIFSKLFAKQVVWVRHNFLPHAGSKNNYRYKFLCKLYSWLNVKAIPLETYYATPALVHPLYRTDQEILEDISMSALGKEKPDIPVLFFGAVKKYKNLHRTLDTWPKDIPLKIAGFCDDASYQRLLEEKIMHNQLNVQWTNKFLSSDELDGLLKRAMYVLLPHADNTMISSGSFYHAIGEGCNVITNASQFGQFKQLQHEFVHIYSPNDMTIESLENNYRSRASVMNDALNFYGEDKVVDAWQNVLFELSEK